MSEGTEENKGKPYPNRRPSWVLKNLSPKYNVPAEIRNRYLQNTIYRLRYERDTSKIRSPGSDMKQIPPKYNVPDQIWNRYRDITAWANMQENDIYFTELWVTWNRMTVRWFKNTIQRKPLTCVAWIPTANQNSDQALHNNTKILTFL